MSSEQQTLTDGTIIEDEVDGQKNADELLERLGRVREKFKTAADNIPTDVDNALYQGEAACTELERVLEEVRDR